MDSVGGNVGLPLEKLLENPFSSSHLRKVHALTWKVPQKKR